MGSEDTRNATAASVLDLAAAAAARASRRERMRPRLVSAGDTDRLARLEERMRSALPRAPNDGRGVVLLDADRGAAADARASVLVGMAFLALNDPDTAADLMSVASTGALAGLAAGSWAMWRGAPIPDRAARAAAEGWLARGSVEGEDESLAAAASAVAPSAADVSGNARLASSVRQRGAPDALSALIAMSQTLARDRGGLEAARAALDLVHGSLGILPDAPRGRVRIAPWLSSGTTGIERLAVGESTLSFRAEVAHGRAVIGVAQESGPTPLTVILEPAVAGSSLKGAEVDGTAAQLDWTREDAGLRARVQLVVDEPRRLTLDFVS